MTSVNFLKKSCSCSQFPALWNNIFCGFGQSKQEVIGNACWPFGVLPWLKELFLSSCDFATLFNPLHSRKALQEYTDSTLEEVAGNVDFRILYTQGGKCVNSATHGGRFRQFCQKLPGENRMHLKQTSNLHTTHLFFDVPLTSNGARNQMGFKLGIQPKHSWFSTSTLG